MTTTQSLPWFHSNPYTPDPTCEYCQGSTRHEFWCITQNLQVLSAWQAVLNAAKLSLHDQLILHALGAAWVDDKQARLQPQPATP